MAMVDDSSIFMIDEAYEFSAPRFFDFIKGETEEEMQREELWLDTALSYAPSPFMPKIKTSRTVQLESLCDFSEAEQYKALESAESMAISGSMTKSNSTCETEKKLTIPQPALCSAEVVEEVTGDGNKEVESRNLHGNKEVESRNLLNLALESAESTAISGSMTKSNSTCETEKKLTIPQPALCSAEVVEEVTGDGNKEVESRNLLNLVTANEKSFEVKEGASQANESVVTGGASSSVKVEPVTGEATSSAQGVEACTPKPRSHSRKGNNLLQTESKKQQTAKKIASMVRNPSALKSKYQSKLSQAKSVKPESVRRNTSLINKVGTPNLAQENQPIKRQKLDGGKTRQILNIKTHTLPHKTRPGLISGSSNLCSLTAKARKEDRKIYAREPAAAPFVSMAEMMNKFQSNTREMSISCASSSLPHDAAGSVIRRKPKLALTRPKEPELETSQRVRSVRVKSSAELEEEMMAKIPKFKARPINKKILEAPTLPTLPRSTPQLPEFQEFHLETMARANHNIETSTIASTESVPQDQQWKPHLTAPKMPTLQTSLRARPPKIKSSQELEQEELEKIPKFKARPLNKKIFESKGELGVFCNTKRQVTVPQEFHFAIDERIPPPLTVCDLFDKLSLNSEPQQNKLPRNTAPNPFHLHTEERGLKKETKFVMEVIQKQLEEEKARVPKANPYPYTTDYPVLPPKPEPKPCTKPEPFQLESLVRHEEEMQREMEERQRIEREEAQMRLFKAQPILKEDPIPVPEKVRKPLTEVQGFDLHVEHRAVDRAEFDKKIKEKEIIYKRYREEAESEKMMEEEKALKQLRRTLVPHARPVPNFNDPFLPQKSTKEATKPKSPKLKILERKQRRKMMIISTAAATSSSASNMR